MAPRGSFPPSRSRSPSSCGNTRRCTRQCASRPSGTGTAAQSETMTRMLDRRTHPYLYNLLVGLIAITALALALSLLSGDIGSFQGWFVLKAMIYVPLMLGYTWWQLRSPGRQADAETRS